MDASRDMAVAAWRGIGADVLRPLGYVRQGQVWRMSDGSLDRLLLLESARGAHALRAHYVHPALDDTSVRRPGWSVYCLPAHFANENHTMGDRNLLEEDLRRHTDLGLSFLSWWNRPAEVVLQHILRSDDPPYHRQAVMPVSATLGPSLPPSHRRRRVRTTTCTSAHGLPWRRCHRAGTSMNSLLTWTRRSRH